MVNVSVPIKIMVVKLIQTVVILVLFALVGSVDFLVD